MIKIAEYLNISNLLQITYH